MAHHDVSSGPRPDRAMPVFTERTQRRVMGATDWWFYPLLALCAFGLIALSLGGDAFDRSATPQKAVHRDGALTWGPPALARGTRVDAAHVRFVVRDLGVSARAVRFAVRPNTRPPAAGDTGVVLLLSPADTESLVGRPVRAELDLRRFSITAAAAIALRIGDGPWVQATLPPASGIAVIDLPPPATAPASLGIRLLTDRTDQNYGVEFRRITLRAAS